MRDRLGEQSQYRTVARAIGIEVAHGTHTAAAQPMLDDDVRLARDVSLEMVRRERRVHMVGAAGRVAEHDCDRPALVELRRRLRGGRHACGNHPRRREGDKKATNWRDIFAMGKCHGATSWGAGTKPSVTLTGGMRALSASQSRAASLFGIPSSRRR